jgi:hypothetical protein
VDVLLESVEEAVVVGVVLVVRVEAFEFQLVGAVVGVEVVGS